MSDHQTTEKPKWSECKGNDGSWNLMLHGICIAWVRSDGKIYIERTVTDHERQAIYDWALRHG